LQKSSSLNLWIFGIFWGFSSTFFLFNVYQWSSSICWNWEINNGIS
jgi:hypothetical protein